jgi:hypothetical protein
MLTIRFSMKYGRIRARLRQEIVVIPTTVDNGIPNRD